MRMNPDSGINALVFLSHFDRGIKRARAIARAYGDDRLHTAVMRACDHLVAVRVEALSIEMCVGINEHFWASSQNAGPDLRSGRASAGRQNSARQKSAHQNQRTLVPGGTSSGTLTSIGFPPSGEAANIIPFDSSPRSFLGARFATITTLRPTRVSGAYASAIPATTCRTSFPISTSSRSNLSAPFTF